MEKIKIMTDSASDISAVDEKRYGISILPYLVTLGDRTYTSRVDFDNEKFYGMMAQYDGIPMTSQITPYEFQEIYLREAKEGVTDLILVLINSKGSATYDNSLMAINLFFEEYPEYRDKIRIHSIDGMGYNALYGVPVVQAAKMREEGASAEKIVGYLEEILPRRQIYFGIYDLKYAAKSGRIPTAAALLGTTLKIKPVMKIFDRSITTAAKCRGEHSLIPKIAEMSIVDMEPGQPYEVLYGCDPVCRDELQEVMIGHLGYGPSAVYQIGAAVAANSGPRAVGISFIRKKE
ncbi:MAG: DegV family protein [Acetatifactor sp.]|nr:DegV family protein [Acetatifactor sp.]